MTIKLNQQEIEVALGTYVRDYLLPQDRRFKREFTILLETNKNSLVSAEITFEERK